MCRVSALPLVGPTGCGKTTLVNLLMRFYEINGGTLRVDGYSIDNVTRDSLRGNLGMVLQETWLKAGTIAENIAYGKPDATREEIIAAAKKAHAHSFICRLPNGYDTQVAEDGGNISQGQRQLLCIARVMLRRPPILILDEATSSIDTRTEVLVQDAFEELMKGRTSFIVAHRLSTIKNADQILVMKAGNIIERGTHEELLAQGGFYKHAVREPVRQGIKPYTGKEIGGCIMSHITIPEGYQSLLGLYDTQKAIGLIKTIFQEKLCMALHLKRVTAPLFVKQGSGLNDDLNGVERPVSFDVPSLNEQAEVVHSLAKWKRYALYKYGFRPGQGIVTDMNAVRRDEELDNLHSIYVDQWDWERVITADQRTLEFLQETVRDIVDAVCATSDELRWKFPELKNNIHLGREVAFITTQELEDRYPDFTPKQRENAFAKEHGTVCIMQIGGQAEERPAATTGAHPDYDDWTLNCDILFWHKAAGLRTGAVQYGYPR